MLVRRVIEGKSVVIEGKRLTPVARVMAWNRQRAVVRSRNLSAFGMVVGWLQPVAVWEDTPQGRCVIPVRDETLRRMIGLLVIAAVVPLVSSLLTRLAFRPAGSTPRKVT